MFSPIRFLFPNLLSLIHAAYMYLSSFISSFLDKNYAQGWSKSEKEATEFTDTHVMGEEEPQPQPESEVYLRFKFPRYEELEQTQNEIFPILSSELIPSSGKSFVSGVIDDPKEIKNYKGEEIGDKEQVGFFKFNQHQFKTSVDYINNETTGNEKGEEIGNKGNIGFLNKHWLTSSVEDISNEATGSEKGEEMGNKEKVGFLNQHRFTAAVEDINNEAPENEKGEEMGNTEKVGFLNQHWFTARVEDINNESEGEEIGNQEKVGFLNQRQFTAHVEEEITTGNEKWEEMRNKEKREEIGSNVRFLNHELFNNEATTGNEKREEIGEFLNQRQYTTSDSDSTGSVHPYSEDDFLSEMDFNIQMEADSESSGLDKSPDFFSSDESDDLNHRQHYSDLDFLEEDDLEIINEAEEENELEELWEHQELMEQLRMEAKNMRASGLPTILEESECPKIMDDLKPLKIEEFQKEDSIGELHKVYRTYRERMRKFDILCCQKMYTMGCLQLKDPLESVSNRKTSSPTLKSHVSQNLWPFKNKIHSSDPTKKFIKELECDLEVVYVAHMCLSWEYLHWQYEKALQLWEADHRQICKYNKVAGEFQQFQVLMQRFIESEPYEGPRVQNYIKNRCLLRNLLQVPVIREDSLKDKRKSWKDRDEYVVTSEMLVEIVEESIRIFFQFVRADKDCNCASKHMPEVSSPEDLKLLKEAKKMLEKKERKVKEVMRSGNCILKKCRMEVETKQVLYFFSKVDMKLVSRVLHMQKVTRDQLIWCHNKLSRISFVHGRIFVEPAFLLFPS